MKMIKTEKHYALWCAEKGLDPTRSENIIKFMQDDDVYYSEENLEIYIDEKNEMDWTIEIDGVDYYKHRMDVDVYPTLYYHLRNR